MRFARSREVMICFCSSHWLTPNCSRISLPLKTRNFSSNFSLEFALPLERQVCRADDQNPFDEAPKLEFADQESGHDGLARTLHRRRAGSARWAA